MTQRDIVVETLWRVEITRAERPDLDRLASAAGVSRFHLTRAFSLRTGWSLMAYVRARRLSEAALQMRAGASVTEAALDAGYDSVEAFSRAFRSFFGGPPSVLGPALTDDQLQEAIAMTTSTRTLPEPRIVDMPARKVHGLSGRYSPADRARIPAQWQRFADGWGEQIERQESFGICYEFDEEGGFAYFCGIADVADETGLETLHLPAGRYACFDHAGHVSTISDTWAAIFESWAPQAGNEIGGGPEIEHYSADFEPEKPGNVAVCIPLKPS